MHAGLSRGFGPGRAPYAAVGTASKMIACGLNQMIMTARVARLEFAIATISLKLSIWGNRRSCGAPPDNEMAVATSVASRARVMPAAMNAASHSRGPGESS